MFFFYCFFYRYNYFRLMSQGSTNSCPIDFSCFKCFSKKFGDSMACVIASDDSVTNSR
jgi:hypothetical protein